MAYLLALTALLSGAAAHYNYPQMIYQGTVQSTPWSQVRQWAGYQNLTPVTNVTSNDIRCNVSPSFAAETLSVAAGSTVGFTASPDIYHPGPILVYMGAVPAGQTAATWDGSGANWFKIWEVPPKVTSSGLDWPYSDASVTSVTFNIPSQVPSGQYLLRFEQIGLHVAYSENGAQFYLSCGQIEVTNGGSGKPSPLVSFPGAYSPTDPGLLINLYNPIPTSYTMPGPAVWPATGSTGSSSSAASTATPPPSHSTTLVTKTTSAPTSTSSTSTSTGGVVAQYGQCGGSGYTGPTTCAPGYTCKASNPYYSQCL